MRASLPSPAPALLEPLPILACHVFTPPSSSLDFLSFIPACHVLVLPALRFPQHAAVANLARAGIGRADLDLLPPHAPSRPVKAQSESAPCWPPGGRYVVGYIAIGDVHLSVFLSPFDS